MSSQAVTENDLREILNGVLPAEETSKSYGTNTGITNYNSTSNSFVVPKDGMIKLIINHYSNRWVRAIVRNSDDSNERTFQISNCGSANHVGGTHTVIPVFKGQKIYVLRGGNDSYVDYIPFV